MRAPYSTHHVELDVTASAYFPGAFTSTDFENRGTVPSTNFNASNFFYGNAGVLLQVGPFGAALTADVTSFTLGPVDFRVVRAHAIAAWAFLHHQLIVGAGVQVATMNLVSGLAPLAPPSGVGVEAGMLLKLDGQPWRFGLSVRSPVSGGVGGQLSTDANGNRVAGSGNNSYIVPESVVFPAQIDVGLAIQLGPRPLNPKWIDPSEDLAALRQSIEDKRTERQDRDNKELARLPEGAAREKRRRELETIERAIRRVEDARVDAEEKDVQAAHDARFRNWPRAKLLVVLDAVVTASVGNAVAVSSFIAQKYESYGGFWTISPRLGLEGEPILDRFQLRFGTYLEASLFDASACPACSARQHFTFGGDLKVVRWDVFGLFPNTTWQVSFAGDLAPRYANLGLSLGVWH